MSGKRFMKVFDRSCKILKDKKSGLTGSDYRVLWALLEKMKYGGKVFCNQTVIAKEACVVQPMVSYSMKKLFELKILSKQKGEEGIYYQFTEGFFEKGEEPWKKKKRIEAQAKREKAKIIPIKRKIVGQ